MTSTFYKVVLIGAGELGSRHLQSVAGLHGALIDVVEPVAAAVAVARQRLAQVVVAATEIRFLTSIAELGEAYDIAIMATGAAVRFELTQQLLLQSRVRYLILEKVLFQKVAHYQKMQELLHQHAVQAYVNCPRRLYPLYQQLRVLLTSGPIHLHVAGHGWGMACNSIHFIDLLAFLTTETLVSVDNSGLTQTIASKRAGYLEVAGQLSCRFSGGSTLTLSCTQDEQVPVSISVHCQHAVGHFSIAEAIGLVTDLATNTPRISNLPMPYQSQLTAGVVSQLVKSGVCSLTPYPESAALHLSFIESLMAYLRHQSTDLDHCPIT